MRWYGLVDRFVPMGIWNNRNDVRKSISDKMIGQVIIYQLSPLNHSCVPNAHTDYQGFTLVLRAIDSIVKGSNITLSYIRLDQNKTDRQKELRLKNFPECQCIRCRLVLDKDLDYEEFNAQKAYNFKLWLEKELLQPSTASFNREYKIDPKFINNLKWIYGEYRPSVARSLVRSFVYFAEHSRFASKPTLKFWYKEIEPLVRLTHGSDHPYYESFRQFAANYMKI